MSFLKKKKTTEGIRTMLSNCSYIEPDKESTGKLYICMLSKTLLNMSLKEVKGNQTY